MRGQSGEICVEGSGQHHSSTLSSLPGALSRNPETKCWFRSFPLGHPQLEGDSSVKSQGKWTINPIYSGTRASQVASSGKEPTCQYRRCKRHGFNHGVTKMPWRRVWQPSPVFLQITCINNQISDRNVQASPPLLRQPMDKLLALSEAEIIYLLVTGGAGCHSHWSEMERTQFLTSQSIPAASAGPDRQQALSVSLGREGQKE